MSRQNIIDITDEQRHDLNVLQDAWNEMMDEDAAINDDGPMMVEEWTGQTWTNPETGLRWYEVDWNYRIPLVPMWFAVNPAVESWDGETETVLSTDEHPSKLVA